MAIATKLKPHSLAELIPSMTDEEFAQLREDIETNGPREPIWLYEGQILDGRHRSRACDELGIEPKTREYGGNEPAGFVISANVHRRHLNTVQLAEVARRFMPALQDEARGRQGKRTDLEPEPQHSNTGGGMSASRKGEAAARAAEAVGGVGVTSVASMHQLAEQAPDLHEKVLAGEVGIRPADEERRARGVRAAPSPEKVFSVSTTRQQQLANKAKERLWQVVSGLSGYAVGLNDFPLERAIAVASDEEIADWISELKAATTAFRNLSKNLNQVQTERSSNDGS